MDFDMNRSMVMRPVSLAFIRLNKIAESWNWDFALVGPVEENVSLNYSLGRNDDGSKIVFFF